MICIYTISLCIYFFIWFRTCSDVMFVSFAFVWAFVGNKTSLFLNDYYYLLLLLLLLMFDYTLVITLGYGSYNRCSTSTLVFLYFSEMMLWCMMHPCELCLNNYRVLVIFLFCVILLLFFLDWTINRVWIKSYWN